MTIDRVATNSQSQYMLAQIAQAEQAMTKSQEQVASGKVSSDYAGIGAKTSALEAPRASAAQQPQQALTTAVGNNDATGLMQQVQSIFDQASQILNSKDANGNYL